MSIHPKLKSRKLILSLVALIAPIACSYLSADVSLDDALKLSVTAVIGYCISQGWVDGKAIEAAGSGDGDDG